MPSLIASEIENIEEKRRSVGIDDIPLRMSIRNLAVGDCVRLTFLVGGAETLAVRITSILAYQLRGKLKERPKSRLLAKNWEKTVFRFTYEHIHSIVRPQLSSQE